jgi:hypothetical protein
MEATGYSRWFERLLAELGIEVWIGDAAEIKTKRVRKQKTDRNDAQLLLKLLLENNFPKIWVPSPKNRDLRQLLWHRHRLVQMRTRMMNQLQALAMNEGQRRKKKLWNEQGRAQLEKLPLATWASRRRRDLLELLDRMNPDGSETEFAYPVRVVAKHVARCARMTDRNLGNVRADSERLPVSRSATPLFCRSKSALRRWLDHQSNKHRSKGKAYETDGKDF